MRLKWDFWARRYDRLWVQRAILGPTRRMVFERMRELGLAPRRVLDVGCGTGMFAAEVAERFPACEVAACDMSPAMLERARARCAGKRVTFVHGSLADIASEGGFDAITCMHVLPYLPDQAAAVAAMRNLLGRNGRLFVVNATVESPWDRAVLSVFKLLVGRAHYPSQARMRDAMHAAGLSDIQATPVPVPLWVPSITLVEGRRPT
jgi:ubiquinone/menaquinone biosynthesis C-methylase UbiE